MSESFVADASIGLAWVHPSQSTVLTTRLLADLETGAVAHVPGLWRLEMGNALLVAARRKLMSDSQRKSALEWLSRLTIVVDPETAFHAWAQTSSLAGKHGLSLYDATYLELALRRGMPLASRDEPLRAAAKKAGVRVL